MSASIGSQREWIVRFHVSWRGQRNIFYNGVEGLKGEWIGGSHIDRRKERVSMRMLDFEGVDCEISHWPKRGRKHFTRL